MLIPRCIGDLTVEGGVATLHGFDSKIVFDKEVSLIGMDNSLSAYLGQVLSKT